MGAIKGIPVTLYERRQTGADALNAPIYEEIPVTVENVLVGPSSPQDVVSDLQLYGKRAEYELYLPKEDAHNWQDCRVDFFGQSFRVFGFPMEYIPQMVPVDWNKRIKVERYG